jgi:chemotaxis protein methyltransferase CheR
VSVAAVQPGDEYVAFCEGVRGLVGIDLLQYKRGQMERRLRTFAQRRGVARLNDYLDLLGSDPGELDRFLDRMTINVSQLWRNPEQWHALSQTVIPELAERGKIRVWSAGCSYGAETYTIAALCLEHAARTRVEVLGTDIDQRMLERAREGVFSNDDARSATSEQLGRWFERVDEGWRANRELRSVVSFAQGDLLRMRIPNEAYDLVLCRNVVIYFTEEVRDDLHRRLADSLRPGGYLVIGSTERVTAPTELGLTPTRPFTYRKA